MNNQLPVSDDDIAALSHAMFSLWGSGRYVSPDQYGSAALTIGESYKVAARVTEMQEETGATVTGRKIGFTNRKTWPMFEPMWGYMYDHSVHLDAVSAEPIALGRFSEPRIEPEIVFGLRAVPSSGMEPAELLECVEWLAMGFEIVQSLYPDWRFSAPEAISAFGLHGALLVGERRAVRTSDHMFLTDFACDLLCDEAVIDQGHSSNVLGGPILALDRLVDLLAADKVNRPLQSTEIVTTGTLTRVPPVSAGETWSMSIDGIDLQPLTVRFA